ncbi:hypothetical protein M0811_06041 [Anaeramoeba ignava]|uniref:Transmembrane protein 230 n=1 Tax=Anaeramoeba ignava TaxID=1746090 RepID=A0A9Q0RFB1_ANAIG|nr:hypothetical protein M0811_06041 [Anaeramoeba ignava]|eukprot:Anaeramoba_ignava/a609437_27.p1 GENE.a609437_27~~a609437_27.p1  ORF type:complete len:141 (-),score=49.24 a609437_27:6-428(-)
MNAEQEPFLGDDGEPNISSDDFFIDDSKIFPNNQAIGETGREKRIRTKLSHPRTFREVLESEELRDKKKTVIIVLFVFLFGLILFFVSFGIWKKSASQGLGVFIVALLLMVAGGYYLFYIYKAIRGESGFQFEEIPNFEN